MVLAIIGAMTTIGGAIGKEDIKDFKDGYEQGWESEFLQCYSERQSHLKAMRLSSICLSLPG